jgi:uncharacterized membrane protein (DUF106 family)
MIEMTPFLSITLVSLGLSLVISIIYRVLTNPADVRKAKDDMKFYKEKMSKAQKEGNKEEASKHASEMMKASQSQMKHSMKPMMATMLLFFLLLGWLHTNFGNIGADFAANQSATFSYAGASHKLYYETVDSGGQASFRAGVDFNDDGEFSQDEIFDQGEVFTYKGAYWRPGPLTEGFLFFTTEKENAVNFEMFVAKSPFTIPFLGDYLSWFWWYIFISLPATIIFRKMLGVE